MDEEISLRVPYVESYVPVGRRKPIHIGFWSTLPVKFLRAEAANLRPAYRISPSARRSTTKPYVVRSFRNALWWPVLVDNTAMSPADFRARASKGDMEIVAMLGVKTVQYAYENRDDFYTEFPYSKIVSDTREQQWARAQRGASDRILFCGDEVLLNAGEPIYYFGSYADFVGPSFSDRHTKLPSRGDNREWIAHRGDAHGIEEIERWIIDSGVPLKFERDLERIEVLIDRHRFDGAALACARALIRDLVSKAMLPSVRSARLRKRFARELTDLANGDPTDEDLCRRVLIQMTLPVPHEQRKDLPWQVQVAENILKRLDELSPQALERVDDEALGALVDL